MPFNKRLKQITFLSGCVSWVLLLVNVLLQTYQTDAGLPATTSSYLNNLLAVIYLASVFLHQRERFQAQTTTDFTTPLWRLFTRGGITAYLCLLLQLGYTSLDRYWKHNPYLLDTIYLVVFAFLTYFLAKAFYTWRQFILYHKTKEIQVQWKWFEILMYCTLVLPLFNVEYMNHIFLILDLGLLLVYALYMSVHLRWVAFLNIDRKWSSIFLLTATLLSVVLYANFLFQHADSPELTVDFTDNPFVLLSLAFVSFYSLSSLLVALFSLPMSRVFEQRQADILNFQKLSQTIQQGRNEEEVFQIFFDSTTKAAAADAAWLEVNDETRPGAYMAREAEPDPAIKEIKRALENLEIPQDRYYVDGDLHHNLQFKELHLPYMSILVMPLASQKMKYGNLYLLREVEQGFDKDTIDVVETFANQTVLTVENLRLISESLQNERYKEELKIASSVQDKLIPKTFPTDTWFEISTYSQAAKEVGGDFYDFLQLSESRIAIVIGDVSGKGISAAFHMAQMKGIFHGLMQQDMLPDEFMIQANSALSRCLERSSFITSALYIIDYKMQGVTFARAGHCHTLYYNSMTEETFYFQTEGLGLGIIRNAAYSKRIHRLHYDYNPGDVMVIYTDGIVEARSPTQDEYGEDRLLFVLSQTYHLEAEDIKYAIINDVNEFSHNTLHDDQTLLVIKFKHPQPNV